VECRGCGRSNPGIARVCGACAAPLLTPMAGTLWPRPPPKPQHASPSNRPSTAEPEQRRAELRHRALAVGVLLVLLWASPLSVGAQHRPKLKSELLEGNLNLAKVSAPLLEARDLARHGISTRSIPGAVPGLPLRDGLPDIEVRLRVLTPEIVAHIQTIGMHVTGVYYQYARLYGPCDLERLEQIAAVPEVTNIYPNYPPVLNAGAVTSQADVSIHAAQARAMFGIDGSGMTVGVLSDSFNSTLGGSVSGTGCARALTGSTPQLSGDLPATVTLLDNGPAGEDEGAALAELIHDLAPGAGIMFRTAANNEADFAQGIDELRQCGADVIVDDAAYLLAPMFQDGLVSQSAQRAVEAGVPYFSTAGNTGHLGADEQYQDANPAVDDQAALPTGDDLHRFASGSSFAAMTLPANCAVQLMLQWNQPFSGTLGPGAANDLDFYAYASADVSSPLLGSSQMQGCTFPDGGPGGDPVETLLLSSGTSPATFYLAVEHFCGSEDVRFRITTIPITCSPSAIVADPIVFNRAQIYGQAAAEGVAAIAPVLYAEIDGGGDVVPPAGQINVDRSSSLGGNLPFFFTGGGAPLPGAPVNRFKPDLAGPDGTNTTFFGVDNAFDSDSFPNFGGSSAAAAHAAAVGALVRSANPGLTPAQVLSAMRTTATDIESAGRDPLSGDGLIDAVGAVAAAVKSLNTPTPSATSTPTVTMARTPTATATRTATQTATTRTATTTATSTSTRPVTATSTLSGTPTATQTPTRQATATVTPAPSRTPTSTATSTPTHASTAPPTATSTTRQPTATRTPTPQACAGDCDGNDTVTIEELIQGVNIALGALPFEACPAFDANGDGAVTVDDLVAAVNKALSACDATRVQPRADGGWFQGAPQRRVAERRRM
jgi:subtilase family protein